ncbi:tyrosine-type recombinase/integrase [Streptomyces sp. NPDC019531]|uniref:tyrosine-type recombinase/integrase n=1 Tax=Streptomyces sp. NPDC019531 TaxID=3365062 RepID=UPI00384FD7E3
MGEEVRVENWNPGELLREWLATSSYPGRVRENYQRSVERWLAHCTEEDLSWDKVAAQHIALWAHRPGAPHSATARRISATRSFYAYTGRHDAVPYNPAARRSRPADRAHLTPSALDPWQTAVLLAALDERGRPASPQHRLDRLCGYLQLGLGLRSAEIVRLSLDDLTTTRDLGHGVDTLRLYDAGGRARLVRFPPLIRDAVGAYLPLRRRPRDLTGGGPLLTSRAGIRIPQRYPGDLLHEVAAECGLLRRRAQPFDA